MSSLPSLPTYAEVSPSGTGIKLFAHGCRLIGKRIVAMPGIATAGHARPQMEVVGSNFYFTVTGRRLPEAPSSLATAEQADAGWKLVAEMLGANIVRPPTRELGEGAETLGMIEAGALEFFLDGLDVCQHESRPIWFGLLCAAHHATGGSPEAREVFVNWSTGNPKFAHKAKRVRDQWTPQRRGYDFKTLIYRLRLAGRDDLAASLGCLADKFADAFEDEWLAEFPNDDPERLALTDAWIKEHASA